MKEEQRNEVNPAATLIHLTVIQMERADLIPKINQLQ